jgi:hypothetical protein
MRMWIRVAVASIAACVFSASCGGLLTAYLVQQLLDDSAPKRTWSGKVTNPGGDPVEGLRVEVRASATGDNNVLTFDDATDEGGIYAIKFRWNENVSFTLRIYEGETMLTEKFIGKVSLGDQTTDFVVQSAISTSISGSIREIGGEAIQGALIIGGSFSDELPEPVLFVDNEGATAFDLSGESGVYELNGPVAQKAIVCAYHPDHGFAYGVAEDTDGDGSVALDIAMGNAGQFNVSVQVVDGLSVPIANQILSSERQFRLRLEAPYNFGTEIDEVVADNALFGGLSGEPSDSHPSSATLIVQSTGNDGIADGQLELEGGSFDIRLLKLDSSDPATALVLSDDPIALGADTVIVVRVN